MVAGAALIQRHTVRLASRYTRAWSVRPTVSRPHGTFVRARRRASAMATADRRVRVAVVGGGAAGLAAAKELRAEGHTPVVFEQGTDVGGVWVYDPRVESDDVTGTDPSRAKVHGSMYASLRTNLPREVMGYPSFPFTKVFAGDDRRFCGHGEVRAYLAAYAEHHTLTEHINTSTEVVKAEPIQGSSSEKDSDADVARWGPRWRVHTRRVGGSPDSIQTDEFDAVVVCNGHYSEPRTPTYPGSDTWPGVQTHSHNYRTPDDTFAGKKIAVLGAMASGEDLSREIATVASEVVLAARGFDPSETKNDFPIESYPENAKLKPGIVELIPECSGVKFEDGSVESGVDVILYATGYKYAFPFLDVESDEDENEIVSAEDNCVSPLYKHVFPPSLAPSLSFIGLPWKVVPFPQFEVQGRWIAKALSGSAELPGRDAMLKASEAFEKSLETRAVAKRHAHRMGEAQFEYNDELARFCGCPPLGTWRAEMYRATGTRKRSEPRTYRDGPTPWSDADAREAARREASSCGFEVDPARDEVEVGVA